MCLLEEGAGPWEESKGSICLCTRLRVLDDGILVSILLARTLACDLLWPTVCEGM